MPRKNSPLCTCPTGPIPTSDHCEIHDLCPPCKLEIEKLSAEYSNYHLLTLTFRPHFDFQGYKTMFKTSRRDVYRSMKRLGKFTAFPELTKSGRLHWHVLIKSDRFVGIKSFRAFWLSKYGSSDWTKVRASQADVLKTFLYIRKDSREMLKALRERKPLKLKNYIITNMSNIPKPEPKRKNSLDDTTVLDLLEQIPKELAPESRTTLSETEEERQPNDDGKQWRDSRTGQFL